MTVTGEAVPGVSADEPSQAPLDVDGGGGRRVRQRRLVLVGVLGAVAVLLGVEMLAGDMMYERRQQHLAGEFADSGALKVPVGGASLLLQIPRIGLNQVVIEGSGAAQLRSGPGRVRGTATVGERGNLVILGRSTRFGRPFARLGELQKGDLIVVKGRAGLVRGYRVERLTTTKPDDPSIIDHTDTERLTLVTNKGSWLPGSARVVVAKGVGPGGDPALTDGPSKADWPPASVLDGRPTSGLLGAALVVLLLGSSVVALVVGARELLRRYRPVTVVVVLLPAAVLLLLLGLFVPDLVLPSVF